MGAYQRVHPVRDDKGRRAWAERHDYCQACGLPAHEAERRHLVGLTTHHISKFRRSDEPCNFLRLCMTCHDLAELRAVRVGGVLLPTLPVPVCLTLKMVREPAEFDLDRLRALAGRAWDPEPVPDVIETEFRRWHPGEPWLWAVLPGDPPRPDGPFLSPDDLGPASFFDPF